MACLAADTSSLILCHKAGVIRQLCQHFSIFISPVIYDELTAQGHDSDLFVQLVDDDTLKVLHVEEHHASYLTGGERDTVSLYYQETCTGILVDDRQAITLCRNEHIPFINALLVPRVLLARQAITWDEYNDAEEVLLKEGRYSREVVQRYRAMDLKELRWLENP